MPMEQTDPSHDIPRGFGQSNHHPIERNICARGLPSSTRIYVKDVLERECVMARSL